MKRGMNNADMQMNNRLLVFRTLLEQGSMTRTQLAECTRLQKATITNIINEFYELDIVDVIGDLASGRRGESLRLKVDDVFIMTMGITRLDYKIAIFSLYGNIKTQIDYSFTNDTFDAAMVQMKKDAADLQEQYGKNKILAATLAVPGLFINRPERKEEIFIVSEFSAISNRNIHTELEETLQRKILVKHDAKLAALGEWRCAQEIQGNERASLCVVRSRGFGIGAGFIVNGKIMNGHMGLAGEVGHMGINYNANRSNKERNGTFEECAGANSAVRYINERLTEFPDSPLSENSTYYDVFKAYEEGDELATWAVHRIAWMLGYGIADIIYMVNPDCVIIGQDYPNTEDFIELIRKTVREMIPPYVADCTTIRYSKLNEDSFLLGGYYYSFDMLCEKENIFDLISQARSGSFGEF